MKYSLSNTILCPLNQVSEKISNPEGTKKWTQGLQNIEQIKGKYCEVGSKRKLQYLFKNKEMIITETILEQNLPNRIKFAYDSKMGQNIVELVFQELSENQVKQTSITTMELKGIMKLLGFMFKPMFKAQSKKYMTAFKEYAEG